MDTNEWGQKPSNEKNDESLEYPEDSLIVPDDFEDDEIELEDAGGESDDLISDNPPVWRLSPDQRITYKTVAGSIAVLIVFMAILFWVNGPKAFERIHGTDLEKDGLKGPVYQAVYSFSSSDDQLSSLFHKPVHFLFEYDEQGNRIKEEYYDANGFVTRRVLFTHDSLGNLVKTESFDSSGALTSETADKQFGLFDPLPFRALQNDPNISRVNMDENNDWQGNWTNRKYFARRHSRMYDHSPIGNESRRLTYYGISAPASGTKDTGVLIDLGYTKEIVKQQ